MTNEPTNKFLLEVEEMNCEKCFVITGHVHTGKYWTCVHCGNQNGKKENVSWFKRILTIFNG